MARAQDQARWRQRSGRRRIEVYLPEDIAERLDALAAERGESRAAVIAALVSGGSAGQKEERHPEAAPDHEKFPDTLEMTLEPPQTGREPPKVRWQKVGTAGWDAIDERGQPIAYVRRSGDGWQAEFIGRKRPGYGQGRTRGEALRDLYQSAALGWQQ